MDLLKRSVVAAAVVAFVGVAGPAFASCQTQYCFYRSALWNLEREQKLLDAIEQDPTDSSHLRQLISYLEHKALTERRVARWRERFYWEAEPRLVDIAADAAIEAGLQHWRRLYRQGTPDPGSSSCRLSKAADPQAELEDLRRSVARQPDSARLAGCLQTALVSVGRAAEAEALAEAFLTSHPDDDVAWRNALALHREGEPGGRGQQLLEGRAARLPSLKHRLELLDFYHRHRLIAQRNALVEVLEAEDLPSNEALRICWQLDAPGGPNDGADHACKLRLFERLAADPSEEAEDKRYSLSQVLLPVAQRRGDWATIERVLAGLSRRHRVYGWRGLVDGAEQEVCPRFVELAAELQQSVAPGTSEHDSRDADALARTFEDCSREDLALETLAPHLQSPPADLEAAREALAAAKARRKLEKGELTRYEYQSLSRPGSPVTAEERRLMARRWVDASPELIEPVYNLIAVYELDGLRDEAAQWLLQAAARHPENVDIPLTVGFKALLWQRHDLVAEAVGMVRASPHARARHRAEAAALAGTVARLEGRWEEASELLVHYFTLRQRFDACAHCDYDLLVHLGETGDSERLASYLEARAAGQAEFEKRHPPLWPGASKPGRKRYRAPSEAPLPDWVASAAAGQCSFSTTAAYLERLAAEGGGELARKRQAKLRTDAICRSSGITLFFIPTARALTLIN